MSWKWALDGLSIPDVGTLYWSDELWDATVAEHTDLITGSVLVELWQRSARPITLSGQSPDGVSGTVSAATRAALAALLDPPTRVLTLTAPDGVIRSVIWNRSNGPALDFSAWRYRVGAAADHALWVPTLNLLEVT